MIDDFTIGRRAMIAHIATLIGAAALPVEALAAPRRRRRKPAASARFLTAPQFALMSATIDTILPTTDTPGALAAGVPARIDALLRDWASPATREALVGALARVDGAAMAAKGKGFVALTPAERTEVLTAHDLASLKKVPPPPGTPKPTIFTPQLFVADMGYHKLKELTINLYYFSPVGTANELVYEHVPGKWRPSIKATPQTRPFLGTGPF